HNVAVWLINTGWSGGAYGEGKRIRLSLTRAMVSAVLSGNLAGVETRPDPIFGVGIPVAVPGVPDDVLQPRETWKNPDAYDRKARELAMMSKANFEENASDAPAEIKGAGPQLPPS
ncbi:MAG: phosphoenolpyruvate carboxykinase (ATP), partial [Chthoniobacteraceae bacterium]